MSGDTPDPVEILLTEDNPGDARLTEEALERSDLASNLHVAGDGVEAMEFVRREGDHADAPRPDLILLDLNVPRKDGREVLGALKGDADLRRIPVVVLTSSGSREDIVESYDRHANAYLTKPVDFDGFVDVVNKLEGFWLGAVELPPE
jgi:CheY-like chemotaxis protein